MAAAGPFTREMQVGCSGPVCLSERPAGVTGPQWRGPVQTLLVQQPLPGCVVSSALQAREWAAGSWHLGELCWSGSFPWVAECGAHSGGPWGALSQDPFTPALGAVPGGRATLLS